MLVFFPLSFFFFARSRYQRMQWRHELVYGVERKDAQYQNGGSKYQQIYSFLMKRHQKMTVATLKKELMQQYSAWGPSIHTIGFSLPNGVSPSSKKGLVYQLTKKVFLNQIYKHRQEALDKDEEMALAFEGKQ